MTKSKKNKMNIKIIVIVIISALIIGGVLTWGFLTNWGQGKKSKPVISEPENSKAVKYTVPVKIKDDIIEIDNPESYGFKIGQIIEIGNKETRTIVGLKSGSLIIDRNLIDTYPENTTIVVIKEPKKNDFIMDNCGKYNENLTCQKCDDLYYLEDNRCKEYTYTSNQITCNIKKNEFTPGTETSDQTCVECTTNHWFVNNTCKEYSYTGTEDGCKKENRKIFIEGTQTSDQKCVQCDTTDWISEDTCKEYSSINQTDCNNQRGFLIPGTKTSDRECKKCSSNQWVNGTTCKTYTYNQTTCNDQNNVFSSGTATSDVTCMPCTTNQWFSGNVCKTYTYTSNQTDCNNRRGFLIHGTATSDQTCQKCSSNQWVDGTTCKTYRTTGCGSYKWLGMESGTATSDRVCYDIIPDLYTLHYLIDGEIYNGKISNDKNYGPIETWQFSSDINTFFAKRYEKEDLSETGLFENIRNFNRDISGWDVSKVTNMKNMFKDTFLFNQSLDNWIVSNVEDMEGMFENAKSFNQPLNAWNVSNVEDMEGMFKDTYSFNQPLYNWNVSKVTNMKNMFKDAKKFNQNISNWIVENTYIDNIFDNAKIQNTNKFTTVEQKICNNSRGEYTDRTEATTTGTCTPCTENQWVNNNVCTTYTYTSDKVTCNGSNGKFTPGTATSDQKCILCMLNQWVKPRQHSWQNDQCYDIIPSRTILKKLVSNSRWWNGEYGGKKYGPIKTWRLGSNITSLSSLFEDNQNFNQDISGWDVSHVMYMEKMFKNARYFNQPLNDWDVSNVKNMSYMFSGATNFNQEVNSWNVSKVRNMIGMFMYATSFDQSLSGWNSERVDVSQMFKGATDFNKNKNNTSGWTGTRLNRQHMYK